MNKLLSWLAFTCVILIYIPSYAQTTVSGKIIDSLSQKPMPFVTIRLTDLNKNTLQSTSTNNAGIFNFTGTQGEYLLQLSFVGYRDQILRLVINDQKSIDLGILNLNEQTNTLNQVNIQAKKSVLSFEPGKINYTINGDPRAEGKDGFEILRYAPLISISGGQSIKLNGQNDFLILLNGKRNSSLSSNAADFLKSFDSKQIERIEVITSPSAKYSAEGIGGIINIITKKSDVNGLFGSLAVGSDSYYSAYLSANVSGRENKFGYSANATKSRFRNGTYTYLLDQNLNQVPRITTGEINPKRELLNLLVQLSYEFNPNHILNLDFNSYLGSGEIDQAYNRGNFTRTTLNTIDNRNFSFGGDYEYKMKNKSSLVFSYKFNQLKDHNQIEIFNPIRFENDNLNTSFENIIQLDYKFDAIEVGGRASLRDFNSTNTGAYNFQQNIFATYINYSKKFKAFNLQSGLRGELADYAAQGNLIPISSSQQFNLFPSFAVDKSFPKSKINVGVGYAMRISRPQLYYLSPFLNNANPYFITSGNATLRPELSHNLELRLTKEDDKGNHHIVMFTYNRNNRPISSYLYPLNDSVLNSVALNLDGRNTFGFSYNSSIGLPKKINLNIYANLYYAKLKKMIVERLIVNDGTYGSLGLDLSGTIAKAYRVSLSNTYSLRDYYLQGYSSAFFYQDLSVNRTFNKWRISFAIRQPFSKSYGYEQTYPDIYQQSINITPQRRVFLGIRYAFGKAKKATTRTRAKATEEDKKTKNSLENIK